MDALAVGAPLRFGVYLGGDPVEHGPGRHDLDRHVGQLELDGLDFADRSNRKHRHSFSKTLYKHGSPIERFFNKIKYFTRLATRYDKRGSSFLAMLQLAAIRLWLRHYESTTRALSDHVGG